MQGSARSRGRPREDGTEQFAQVAAARQHWWHNAITTTLDLAQGAWPAAAQAIVDVSQSSGEVALRRRARAAA